jgi:lysophospholipase L1-like esterase
MPRQTARVIFVAAAIFALNSVRIFGDDSLSHQKWVATWTASSQGPYPYGFAVAQPDLRFVLPSPSIGASDQTFRMIVKPDLWGSPIRLQFANEFGTQPVRFDEIFVALQASGGNLVPRTNTRITFSHGKSQVTIAPGARVYSDPIVLSYVKNQAQPDPALAGRKLAVSFHTVGSTGPITWHTKALQTSYLTAPSAGAHSQDENDRAFAFTTTSWFFIDSIDVMAPEDTAVVAAFGDSITDGTASTLSGDDRWPDFLSSRLHAAYGGHVSVVNTGIGGNQVLGPPTYSPDRPAGGGPAALQRLDRDVLDLSGLTAVVWMEGINDFGMATSPQGNPNISAEEVIAGLRAGVARMHAREITVIGGTLTSSLNSTVPNYGTPAVDAMRKTVNAFIRSGEEFDSVADFDAATIDFASGSLRPEFQPNSTVGGPGDLIHPNRAGYLAMANAIDIKVLAPSLKKHKIHPAGSAYSAPSRVSAASR